MYTLYGMIIDKLRTRFTRVKEIYQKEGLVTLLKRIYAFLLCWFSYEKCTFYVHQQVFEHRNEADFMPRIQNFTCRIVETTQQLDELSKENFNLSLLNITQAYQVLERGAILTLIFVERELAYTGWTALTEEAKNIFNRYPYKVDFSNNEACTGGTWTNPKYRRQGLHHYGMYKRREYLLTKGIRKLRGISRISNTAVLGAHKKSLEQGVRRTYAKARYLRIGRVQFWKEIPIKSIHNDN